MKDNNLTKADKTYHKSHYIFTGLAIICFLGFYKTYFGSIASFSSTKLVVHCHAVTVTLWLFILIVQPIFIVQKKITIHKFLGRLTYYLFPFIIIFVLLMEKSLYQKLELEHSSHQNNLAGLFAPFTNTIPFALFYLLALKYKKNVGVHARYMVGTGLMLLSSGLWRIFNRWLHLDIGISFEYALWITLFVIVAFIIYDKLKGIPLKRNPFTLIALIHLITNILSISFPHTAYWQSFSQWIVTNTF